MPSITVWYSVVQNTRTGSPLSKLDLAGGQADQYFLALRRLDPVERLAVSLAAMRVGRGDAGPVKLRRRQRQLVALARRALLPGSLHIEPVALAPAAGERAIDVELMPRSVPFGLISSAGTM